MLNDVECNLPFISTFTITQLVLLAITVGTEVTKNIQICNNNKLLLNKAKAIINLKYDFLIQCNKFYEKNAWLLLSF